MSYLFVTCGFIGILEVLQSFKPNCTLISTNNQIYRFGDILRNVKNAPISFINIKKNVNEMKNVIMNGKSSVILSM